MSTTYQNDVVRPRSGPPAHVVDVVRGGPLKGRTTHVPRHHDHAAYVVRSEATDHVNPFRERIRERQRRMGGQHAPSPTDTLGDDYEALVGFEAERAAVAGVEGVPW
jgi:hypothetical protein